VRKALPAVQPTGQAVEILPLAERMKLYARGSVDRSGRPFYLPFALALAMHGVIPAATSAPTGFLRLLRHA
jgi:hypothetical protein